MKILLLAHYYPPEMGGAAARLHGLARWLAAYGHQVTVLTGFPNYPTGVVLPAYHGKLRAREEIDGVEVVRTWVYASAHDGCLRRLANYASYVVSAVLSGLGLRRRFDVVLASSPPLFVGLAGLALAQRYGAPLVFDLRDLWPDVAVDAGAFRPDAPITRLGYALARYLYRRADHITPVTEQKRLKLVAAGVPADKLTVVPNGVDLDRVQPVPVSDKRVQLGLNGEFLVLYAGLIGIAQGVEIAVHAADRLRAQRDVHFLIVGDGVRRDAVAAQVAERGLHNVTMLPRQPREEIAAFLDAADAALVPLASSDLQDAVPSKLLEAWAYRRPVILAAGGEAAQLVRRSGGGVVVCPERPDELVEAILHLKSDRARLQRCAQQGRAYVEQRFDRRALARQMEAVLQDVVERHRSDRCALAGQPRAGR